MDFFPVEPIGGIENASHDIYENSHLYYNCLPPIIEVAELQEYIKQKISQGDFEIEFKVTKIFEWKNKRSDKTQS